MRNVYDPNDPEKLLRLKRQESHALLDVIRAINLTHLKQSHIFKIAQNVLLAQLGVKKMAFLYLEEEELVTGVRLRMAKGEPGLRGELPKELGAMKVEEEQQPGLFEMGVEYVVPMQYQNKVGAWFLIADFAETQQEVDNDLIFIETIGNVLAVSMENRALLQARAAQEAVRRELEVAEKIQKQLLPTDHSLITSADIFALNVAHDKVGGDFYDVISRGEKGFFLCIADVSGKGIGAALLMANLLSRLRSLILSENQLESVIRKLNQSAFEVTQGEKFVTLFLAHVRVEDQQIDYINAGHNNPIHMRPSELKANPMDTGTIVLGALEELPFVEEATIDYQPDDLLFLYTDGLVEQTNEEGEMLGEEAVLEALRRCGCEGARDVVDRVNALYEVHAAGAPAEDDTTLLAVRFLSKP